MDSNLAFQKHAKPKSHLINIDQRKKKKKENSRNPICMNIALNKWEKSNNYSFQL